MGREDIELGVLITGLNLRVKFICPPSRIHSRRNLEVDEVEPGEQHLSQVRPCAKL